MSIVWTTEEFLDELDHMFWLAQFPWTQWYINHMRKKEGLPPYRNDRPPLRE